MDLTLLSLSIKVFEFELCLSVSLSPPPPLSFLRSLEMLLASCRILNFDFKPSAETRWQRGVLHTSKKCHAKCVSVTVHLLGM